jgi:hypothetical protein
MIHYYIHPKTRSLIMLDPDEGEIFVVERIEKVRVMTGGDIRLGDFEGLNPSDTPDKFDKHGGYRNPHLHKGGNFPRMSAASKAKAKKPRACGNCGEIGHRRDTCPNDVAPMNVETAAAA